MIPQAPLSVEVILPVFLTGNASGDSSGDTIIHTDGIRWLNEAIQSVFDQTYPHWHLTLVDDGSELSAKAVMSEWARSYPDKVACLENTGQRGASKARMVAAHQTRADLIMFLDQDDIYHPDKLTRQVSMFQENRGLGAVHTNIEIIDEQGDVVAHAADRENLSRSTMDYLSLGLEELATALFVKNNIRIISGAFNRDIFLSNGGYDLDLDGGEDWELWVRLASRCKIGHIDEILLQRRVHACNTSRKQRSRRSEGLIYAVEKMTNGIPYLNALKAEKIELLSQRLHAIEQNK